MGETATAEVDCPPGVQTYVVPPPVPVSVTEVSGQIVTSAPVLAGVAANVSLNLIIPGWL